MIVSSMQYLLFSMYKFVYVFESCKSAAAQSGNISTSSRYFSVSKDQSLHGLAQWHKQKFIEGQKMKSCGDKIKDKENVFKFTIQFVSSGSFVHLDRQFSQAPAHLR